jgi:predicted esterase
VQVRFETYAGMGHSACPAELEEVRKFISQRLA